MKLALVTALASACRESNAQLIRVTHGARGGKPRPGGRGLGATQVDEELNLDLDKMGGSLPSPELAQLEEVAAFGSKASKKSKKGGQDQGTCPFTFAGTCDLVPFVFQIGPGFPISLPAPGESFPVSRATLTCDSEVSGSTVDEPSDPRLPCLGADYSSGAVWYELTGLSGTVALDMCSADYDSAMAVAKVSEYNGFPLLECVAFGDEGCDSDGATYLEFDAEAGATYWARVHGYVGGFAFGPPEGNFTLSVTCNLATSLGGQYSNATKIRKHEEQKAHQYQKKEDEALRG